MTQKKQVEEVDPHTDGIDMGVVWQADQGGASPGTVDTPPLSAAPSDEPGGDVPRDAQEGTKGDTRRSEGGTGETEGRLIPAGEPDDAVTPKKALLEDINAKIGGALSAWHTYAMLACHKRWQTIEGYVQDPDLYEEIVTEARAEIRREKAAVAKRLDKAKIRKDAAQISVLTEELEELSRKSPSAMKMDALTLKARGGRLARQLAVPAGVLVGPVAGVVGAGWWWALLVYPIAWGWLAAQGHAMAVADGTVTVTEEPAEKARELVGQAGVPGGRPRDGATTVVMGATEAENIILGHLAEWESRSAGRGLEGVVPGTPAVDVLGIRVVLTLSGKATTDILKKKMPAVRAALSVPRDVRSDLSEGDLGDQSILRIRTRTPSRDMVWRPGRVGIGLDTDTGQPVVLPKGRKLIAGTSGAGKSVLVRVRIAEALTATEPTAVVYIDPKGEESALWRGKVRIATTPEEVMAVLQELHRESDARSAIMQRQGSANWIPTQERPRIVLMVDEGAELISMDDPNEGVEVIKLTKPLATMGRARAVDVEWTTQKPTVGEGIPSQLIGVMQDRLTLKTADRKENNLVMGSGWSSHELELGGFAVTNMNGRGSDQAPIQVWDLSDDAAVAQVPGGRVWRYEPDPRAPEPAEEAPEEGRALPRALGAAMTLLDMSEDANGLTSEEIASWARMDLLDTQNELRAAGAKAGRFTKDGRQIRGYRREDLEEAAERYTQ